MLALTTSCVAGRDADGSTATIDAPARKVAVTAMLRKLDLDVPADLAEPELSHDAPALVAAPAFDGFAATAGSDDASRALDCLTKAVYYEAGNQSDDGQRAVAQVVLNRVRDRAFPSSVCGVVYQGSARSTGCQFSFTCDGSLNRTPSAAGWERARTVASAALGGSVYAPVGSATFYHADYVSPWWAASMDHVATVGAHIFYRWRGGMERALAFRQRYSGVEPPAAARSSAAVASVNGVTISYGGGVSESGVTVHRGTSATAAPAAAMPAAPMAAVVHRPRAMIAGVRIHRGVSSSGAGEDYSDQAVVD